jgi:hypothetical protein
MDKYSAGEVASTEGLGLEPYKTLDFLRDDDDLQAYVAERERLAVAAERATCVEACLQAHNIAGSVTAAQFAKRVREA